MNEFKLGVLDFGELLPPGLLPHHVINNLFEDVSVYERLGYKRLWLSEHYSPEFAWLNPEMLLPLLAGYSEKIKIGIAGILLNYHSPLRVAQNFKILSSIYHNRIDLGLARAFVPEEISAYLVPLSQAGKGIDDWEVKIKQLTSFVRETEPAMALIKNTLVPPHGTSRPDLWVLGSSKHSLGISIREKLNFCLSFMHPGSDYKLNRDTLKNFREEFYSLNAYMPETAVLLCCAVTEDAKLIQKYNQKYNGSGGVNLFGTADYIKDRLLSLHSVLHNDEFIIHCPVIDREERLLTFKEIISR